MSKTKLPKGELPQVYRVKVQYEVMVLAHSQQAAETFATNLDPSDCEFEDVYGAVVTGTLDVSQNLLESLPYIADDVKKPEWRDDITVRDWITKVNDERDLLKTLVPEGQGKLPL